MLVELFNAGTQKIQKFLNTRFTIYEKLDMYYFKVRVDAEGATPVKISDNSDITYEDAITNTLYFPILEFCNNMLQDSADKLYMTLGRCIVGLFYCPGTAKFHIRYNEKLAGRFVFSDIYTDKYDFNSKEIFKLTYKELFDSFQQFYSSEREKAPKDFCMVSGEYLPMAKQHIKGIVPLYGNAKLISANDNVGYTNRGR